MDIDVVIIIIIVLYVVVVVAAAAAAAAAVAVHGFYDFHLSDDFGSFSGWKSSWHTAG